MPKSSENSVIMMSVITMLAKRSDPYFCIGGNWAHFRLIFALCPKMMIPSQLAINNKILPIFDREIPKNTSSKS